MSFGPLDAVIVGAYVAALLALGFSARLRENTALQFLAAGRALTLPVFVAALVSQWYGGILAMGEAVSYFGLGTWVLLGLPYYVFAAIYAVWLAPRVRGVEQISIPERFALRYGRGPALVAAALVFCLAVPAAHVLMLGLMLRFFTGWPILLCTVLVALGGSAFIFRGGLLADARASLLAFVFMYLGFAALVGYCLTRYPPVPTWQAIPDPNALTWDGGSGWLYVTSFFILGAWTLVDPGFHQRVASAASPRVAQRGLFVCILFWMLFDAMTISAGMYARALLSPMPEEPLLIFPAFGAELLPAGLKALFFCGMIGTMLSAMVGYALVSGGTLGREIWARLRPGVSERQVTWASRVGIAIGLVVAIALSRLIPSVVNLWYQWAGAVIGALLLPLVLAYRPASRVRRGWVGGAMALSFAGSMAWLIVGHSTGNAALELTLGDGRTVSIGTLLPGLVLSGLVLAIGSFASRREGK